MKTIFRKSVALIIFFLSSVVLISVVLRAEKLKNPAFEYVSSNWSRKSYKIRMDDIWQDEGIHAKGLNYYFFPKPAQGNQYSERFNPQSKYFQAWFGVYTIEDVNNTTYALSNNNLDPAAILKLAIADQKAWLRTFGLSQPLVEIDPTVPLNVSPVRIDGHPGWKITGRIITNADVGANNPQLGFPLLLYVPSVAPSTAWQGLIESYGVVDMDVVFYVWHTPGNRELNAVYYSGVEFDDLNHSHHRTLPLLSGELDSMALSITVRK